MPPAVAPVVMLLLVLALAGLMQQAQAGRENSACGDTLAFQVLLDRRGFSPGEIDGSSGPNLTRALRAFQQDAGLRGDGTPNCETWSRLSEGAGSEVLTEYTLTEEDVKGPFLEEKLPGELAAQATLAALSYENAREAIAERFHASPQLIAKLNPNATFEAGHTIRVPAVTPFDATRKPAADTSAQDVSIKVSKSGDWLEARRADGSLVFFAPVASGSEHDPLPIGTWKVTGTSWMPPFHYNPELFWDAEATDTKALIKPGPNNPVGVVWVDINVPHYGLHGTPSPNLVGHAQSHGCVRLTNWDAARLASLVKPGTRVEFVE